MTSTQPSSVQDCRIFFFGALDEQCCGESPGLLRSPLQLRLGTPAALSHAMLRAVLCVCLDLLPGLMWVSTLKGDGGKLVVETDSDLHGRCVYCETKQTSSSAALS